VAAHAGKRACRQEPYIAWPVTCNSWFGPAAGAGPGQLADFFLVECKGWTDAVGSEQVSWFLTKIRHRGVRFGILIAANGITGDPEHLSRAHFQVGVELATHGIRMVIVTRQELEILASGEEFARLILQKVCTLHASCGRCY
jgi:hypothetical protein